MSDIMEQLNQVDMRLSDDNFLANKGMSNEVGIHVFSYKPSEEIVVSEFFKKLIADDGKKYHLIEFQKEYDYQTKTQSYYYYSTQAVNPCIYDPLCNQN